MSEELARIIWDSDEQEMVRAGWARAARPWGTASEHERRSCRRRVRALSRVLADDIEAACNAWGPGFDFCDRLRALVAEARATEGGGE